MTKTKDLTKFNQKLLDELLVNYDLSNPEGLIGRDGLLSSLKKALIERALNTEIDMHLGYKKNERSKGSNTSTTINSTNGDGNDNHSSAIYTNVNNNYRNGTSSKTIITDEDKISIDVPRNRDSSFEPLLIKKGQKRFTGFDDKVISMYARGMTVREYSLIWKIYMALMYRMSSYLILLILL